MHKSNAETISRNTLAFKSIKINYSSSKLREKQMKTRENNKFLTRIINTFWWNIDGKRIHHFNNKKNYNIQLTSRITNPKALIWLHTRNVLFHARKEEWLQCVSVVRKVNRDRPSVAWLDLGKISQPGLGVIFQKLW